MRKYTCRFCVCQKQNTDDSACYITSQSRTLVDFCSASGGVFSLSCILFWMQSTSHAHHGPSSQQLLNFNILDERQIGRGRVVCMRPSRASGLLTACAAGTTASAYLRLFCADSPTSARLQVPNHEADFWIIPRWHMRGGKSPM